MTCVIITVFTHTTPNLPSKDGLSLILYYLLRELKTAHTFKIIALDQSPNIPAELNTAIDQQAVIYLHGPEAAKLVPQIKHYPRLVVGMIDTQSLKYQELAKKIPGTLAKRRWLKQAAWWSQFEQNHLSQVNHIIVGGEVDRQALVRQVSAKPFISVIPNGVDSAYFSPDPAAKKTADMIYSGMMDQPSRIQAILQFAQDVWPAIHRQLPQTRFLIVGKEPAKKIMKLAKTDPAIVVTGFVPEVRDWLRHAMVFVSPLHLRFGMRNTMLEAMACGLPVVAYAESCTGLETSPIRKVSTAPDFSDTVTQLLQDAALRLQVGALSRKYIEQHHHWPTQAKLYEHVFDQAKN